MRRARSLAGLVTRGIVFHSFLVVPAIAHATTPPVELMYPARVNTFYPRIQRASSVCLQPGGGAVVVWQDGTYYEAGYDGSSSGIQMQRFFENGTRDGSETTVNTVTADSQLGAVVACDATGDFVVAWESGFDGTGPDGSGATIAARRYEADGTPKGPEFVVNSSTLGDQTEPDICAAADGSFVVVWSTEDAIVYGRKFDANGVALGPEFSIDPALEAVYNTDPAVGCAADGRFVVAWTSEDEDSDVMVRRFDADTTPAGLSSLAHEENYDYQAYYGYSPEERPLDISVAADGRFVVAWTEQGEIVDYAYAIMARRFASDGTPLAASSEVSVRDVDDYFERWDVSVALSDDGAFAISYLAYDYDAGGGVVQLYNADGTRNGPAAGVGSSYDFGIPATLAAGAGESYVVTSTHELSVTDSDDVYINRFGGNMCSPLPASGCRVTSPGQSKLQVVNAEFKDKLKWKWKKGAATPYEALGNPVSGITRYQVCLYDSSMKAQPIYSGLVQPSSMLPADNWRTIGDKGFRLSTRSPYTGGITKLSAKSGEVEKSSVQATAAGNLFDATSSPFVLPVTIQLVVPASSGFECWQTTFTAADHNLESKFSAKGP